tara:strand:+ start:10996 stop:11529 length:534 start_codon:yes stop_codon:yes gene_type:complete
METLYQERIEIMINTTLKEILLYSIFAYTFSKILEFCMPVYDEEKDVPSLIIELFVQLTLTVCIFMLFELKFPARYGMITYILVSVASQDTFIKKMNLLHEKMFTKKYSQVSEKTEEFKKGNKEQENNSDNKKENPSNHYTDDSQDALDYVGGNFNEDLHTYELENQCTSLDNLPSF